MAKFKPYLFEQGELLPQHLGDWIPDAHLVRTVSDIVDQLDLRPFFDRYRERGEEAYHPRMLIKVLFYGYATGVMSSRELEHMIHFHICFRWLCGSGAKPNFRTISDFRKNHLHLLPDVFQKVSLIIQELGYASLQHVSVDGSKVKANASKHKAMSRERMKQELEKGKQEIAQALQDAQKGDDAEAAKPVEEPEQRAWAERRRTRIQAALAELEERKPEDQKGSSGQDQINFTDSDSRIMDTKNQGITQAYNPQITVDADHGFIVGLAMSNSSNDIRQFDAVLDSVKTHTGRLPEKVSADAGYFSAANITACDARGIDGYIAASREGKQAGNAYDKSNFTYHPEDDVYVCPAGNVLHLKHTQHAQDDQKPTKWVYECQDCGGCPFQKECAKARSGLRTITRTESDPKRESMRTKVQGEAGRAVYGQRKAIVEHVWGEIKQIMGFRQFHLRGLKKVDGEFTLVAIAYNVRKLHSMRHPKADTQYRRERSAQKRGKAA